MNCYLSPFAQGCVPYQAGEQPRDRRYVKLNTNENPYPPAPAVLQALCAVPGEALRRYPDPNASELGEALGRARGVPAEGVYVGNGSDEVLALTFPAFFGRGARVAFSRVTYSFYPVFASFFGVEPVQVPLLPDWRCDLGALAEADAKGVLLCNPNAPTGLAASDAEVEELVARCHRQGKVVIVDQAYAPFSQGDAAPLVRRYDNLLVVETFSKGWALAGMRVGYALGDPGLIEGLKRMRDCFNSYPVDGVAAAAALAALSAGDYYRAANAAVVEQREAFQQWLAGRGIPYLPSSTNFVFVQVGQGERVLQALRRQGVLVRYFAAYPEWLRVTVGTPQQMEALREALTACL